MADGPNLQPMSVGW